MLTLKEGEGNPSHSTHFFSSVFWDFSTLPPHPHIALAQNGAGRTGSFLLVPSQPTYFSSSAHHLEDHLSDAHEPTSQCGGHVGNT